MLAGASPSTTLVSSSIPPRSTSRFHSRRTLPLPKTPLRRRTTTPPPPLLPTTHRRHTDLLLESYHRNHVLRQLLRDLSADGSDVLQILHKNGDWTTDQFWVVVRFLKERGSAGKIRQVFDAWTERESSRINASNCSRMVRLLCEVGAVPEAVSVLEDMERCGLSRSVSLYNAVIGCYAAMGEFDAAVGCIEKMRMSGLVPVNETYNGLIRAYGDRQMYDVMSKCVKRMGVDGCSPDESTLNLLITEYAQGRLLEKMEGHCRTLMSKKLKLHPSTLVEMLEAYAELGIVEKTDTVVKRILNSDAFLKESLIRKVASVYIKNYRFARLEEFGMAIGSRTGRTLLVWCIILLASACLLSLKGMKSVSQEMGRADVKMSITFVNIVALAYLKMRDFKRLDALLSRIGERDVKPDIVTVGVLFDGCEVGYDCTRALETWRRYGFLDEVAEINTDPLVLEAFGKGSFLKNCEKLYTWLDNKAKEKREWRYRDLINLVFRNSERVRINSGIN